MIIFVQFFFGKYEVDKDFTKKDKTRRRINIIADDNGLYIDFHYNTDGTTTIEDFGGNCVEIKKQLAHYIKDNCKIDCKNDDSWYVIKDIDESDFEGILEILLESELYKTGHEMIKEDKGDRTIYRLKGKYNEDLVITYYSTKTVQIQGKPLLLFNEAMGIFSELLEIDEMPQVFNKFYKVNVTKDDIRERCKLIMISSHDQFTGKLRTCIHQAIYYLVIDGDMFEYSSLPLSAYRVLEGHMKYVLKEFKLPTTKKKKIGNYFYFDGAEFKMIQDAKNEINNNDKISNLEAAYNQYNNIRHMLSHWDDLEMDSDNDTTEIINNIEVARRYILDALRIIDAYYIL